MRLFLTDLLGLSSVQNKYNDAEKTRYISVCNHLSDRVQSILDICFCGNKLPAVTIVKTTGNPILFINDLTNHFFISRSIH